MNFGSISGVFSQVIFGGQVLTEGVEWDDSKLYSEGIVSLKSTILLPGDANQDGVVDIADLGIVGANFNKTSVEWSQGDFNGDMKVDIADLGIIGANWTAADSAVALYAASNPRTASLYAKNEAARSNRLDLAALLEQDDQTELARILGGHSIL